MVNGENITDHSVTWSVDGAVSEATEIDETGLLTVAEDETAEQLTRCCDLGSGSECFRAALP